MATVPPEDAAADGQDELPSSPIPSDGPHQHHQPECPVVNSAVGMEAPKSTCVGLLTPSGGVLPSTLVNVAATSLLSEPAELRPASRTPLFLLILVLRI